MQLHAKVPGIVAEDQSGQFLVGEHGDTVAVFAVGLACLLGDDVLPTVEEVRTSGAVGDDGVGVEGLHGFKFLPGIGDTVAPVGLHVVLPETIAAAVAPLRVVHHLSAPALYHAGQHVGVLCTAHTLAGEHLRVVASDVLHDFQRFARLLVDEVVFGLGGNLVAPMVDEVTGMGQVFGLVEFAPAGFPQILADLGLQFGKLVPGL